MPAATISGTRIGTRITSEAIISMNSPTISRKTFRTSISSHGVATSASIDCAIFCGTCS